jgi:3-dehydroquinate dehydratase/shikimate dehydrogenase
MVYNPAETRLVKLARAKGIQVILGTEMFVHQGARQFEIWTGKPAPAEEMHRAVLHGLGIVSPSVSAGPIPAMVQART